VLTTISNISYMFTIIKSMKENVKTEMKCYLTYIIHCIQPIRSLLTSQQLFQNGHQF
jgi:hypothetical protein